VDPRLVEGLHSRPQQFDSGAAEHRSFEGLQTVDLAFGLAAAPWFGNCVPDGLDVTAQRPRELL